MIHVQVTNEYLIEVFEALWSAGQKHGITPFGLLATESMRLEKGYKHWKADLITEYNPFETSLERFVKMDKDFIGKHALERMVKAAPRRNLVMMELHDTAAPAHAGDSVLAGEKVVGTVTSAAWGYRVKKNLAFAFVDPDHSDPGSKLSMLGLNRNIPATITDTCLYDSDNRLPRS